MCIYIKEHFIILMYIYINIIYMCVYIYTNTWNKIVIWFHFYYIKISRTYIYNKRKKVLCKSKELKIGVYICAYICMWIYIHICVSLCFSGELWIVHWSFSKILWYQLLVNPFTFINAKVHLGSFLDMRLCSLYSCNREFTT